MRLCRGFLSGHGRPLPERLQGLVGGPFLAALLRVVKTVSFWSSSLNSESDSSWEYVPNVLS